MKTLTDVQRAIILGTLLGDGSMRCKTNALLEINHSVRQRAYVDWKYQHLANLVSTPPKERHGNAGRVAYRFVTRSLPALTPFYELFYSGRVKDVPDVEHRIRLTVSGTSRLAGVIGSYVLPELRYKLPQFASEAPWAAAA